MPLPPRPSSPFSCINIPSPSKERWRPCPGPPRRRHQSRHRRHRHGRHQRLRLLRVPPTAARPPRTSSTTASRSLTTGQAPRPGPGSVPRGGGRRRRKGTAAMLGRAAEEEEEEEEGRGRWVSLARSLFLASLSLPASCVAPPRGVRPLSLALALSFFGRHAEGKVRRRPPDPRARRSVCPSPARGTGRQGGGLAEAHQPPRPPLLPELAVSGLSPGFGEGFWGRGPRILLF